jgi:hypothetical protein
VYTKPCANLRDENKLDVDLLKDIPPPLPSIGQVKSFSKTLELEESDWCG